jgi:hypothetical protein
MLGLVEGRAARRRGHLVAVRSIRSGSEQDQPVVLGEVGVVAPVEGEQRQSAFDAAGGDPGVV